MMPVAARQVLVVDVETTGVEPQTDSIIEIGACLLEPVSLAVVESFQVYVRPDSEMSPAAQAIHGRSAEDLQDAPSVVSAIRLFDSFAHADDVLLCGHNISFDNAFLKAAYRRAGVAYKFDYHVIDIWSIAFTFLRSKGVMLEKYNLDELSRYYGLKRGELHNALEDATASAAVLRAIYFELAARDGEAE